MTLGVLAGTVNKHGICKLFYKSTTLLNAFSVYFVSNLSFQFQESVSKNRLINTTTYKTDIGFVLCVGYYLGR